MFFWNGRLYYRWFTTQSGTLGADTFVASGATDGRDWSAANGLTMASGRLLYATTTGTLSTVGAPPSTASPGSPAPCSSSPRPTDGIGSGILRPTRPCSSRDRAAVS
jgi:hypothetical protein